MNEWQVIGLLAGILTFFVGTMIPLLKILLKVNSTIQGNTDTIKSLKETLDETIIENKKEHDHFFSSINKLNIEVNILQEKHRKDN